MLAACEKYHKKLELDRKKVDLTPADTNKILQSARNYVVFLNNLAFDVDEKDIKEFFKKFEIKTIEIVKNVRGISRGFAFIEFSSLTDLSKVLDMKAGVLKGREFTISKSKREITQKAKKDPLHSVLSKKDANEIEVEEDERTKKIEAKNSGPMKSNDDFRKMFLK